ncbi:unnamed protein product [Allacma fusca]|uniref:O-acyltransferase WSD1 C-terminal domain-containing protein n=1 Tax=Allacma fusca TaxID=39272 RepID=A0A8J2PCW5_9HEXA|nr:unnamed protein product [Allacma fusca]
MSTILFSNFAGPVNPLKFIAGGGGDHLTDINFSGGTGTGKVGLAFGLLSYAGGIRIVTHSDKSILPDDLAVEQLNKDIMAEFELMSQSTPVFGQEIFAK